MRKEEERKEKDRQKEKERIEREQAKEELRRQREEERMQKEEVLFHLLARRRNPSSMRLKTLDLSPELALHVPKCPSPPPPIPLSCPCRCDFFSLLRRRKRGKRSCLFRFARFAVLVRVVDVSCFWLWQSFM
jgi:hypothetical protein